MQERNQHLELALKKSKADFARMENINEDLQNKVSGALTLRNVTRKGLVHRPTLYPPPPTPTPGPNNNCIFGQNYCLDRLHVKK